MQAIKNLYPSLEKMKCFNWQISVLIYMLYIFDKHIVVFPGPMVSLWSYFAWPSMCIKLLNYYESEVIFFLVNQRWHYFVALKVHAPFKADMVKKRPNIMKTFWPKHWNLFHFGFWVDNSEWCPIYIMILICDVQQN